MESAARLSVAECHAPTDDTAEVVHARVSAHAIERAEERYGLTPTEEEWRETISDIVNGRSVLAAAAILDNGSRERHLVTLSGQRVKVIWCPENSTVITVLGRCESIKMIQRTNRLRARSCPPRRMRDRLRRELLGAD